jgi:hypothetical protein
MNQIHKLSEAVLESATIVLPDHARRAVTRGILPFAGMDENSVGLPFRRVR